ncbi:cation transport protein-domain-containing protein [Melanogaster broomeanus]|nr:cation transport protein-domain-containing protein [Melanogaster broomeanus]
MEDIPSAYIDALFNSVSAVTVCGLATVNLSQLTPWQQVILFLQMCVGSPVVVSWAMVYIRRYFFAKKFEYIVQAQAARSATPKVEAQLSPEEKEVRTDMIHRMDSPPKLVNPSGWISRGKGLEFAPAVARHPLPVPSLGREDVREPSSSDVERRRKQDSRDGSYPRRRSSVGVSMTHHPTQDTYRSARSTQPVDQVEQLRLRHGTFGGFPMPHELLGMLFRRLFPGTANRLHRTVTIPATTALTGGDFGRTTPIHGQRPAIVSAPEGSKSVAYISFDAVVGRNSAFHMLSNGQLEELGGVEYRALNAPVYHFGIQLISFIVVAPYMSLPKWANDFTPPALIRPVATPWFSLFQVVSAYTNTGMSLVDQSMLPFQTAYPMIFFMMVCILAGNTGFVSSSLRFMIWTITKFVPADSRLNETLHFLLDHPRRCFVYLFPSHQTWFLLTVLLMLNLTDFFCFMVLDIGNPVIDSIPLGTRFVGGLLQAIAVRASGFVIVPLASLAPAVQVMFAIMMYVSVCDVRSTNVYEEQSLGIYRNYDEELLDVEREFQPTGSRMTVWGRYLARHARHQLSFDMWWLALALFLVCIIEKDSLTNTEIQGWFNIFTILFELISAYGSVGLSLGIPNQNYSFSAAWRPLSKLIICLVMIRGRHRGLPVAIDRAVMLPFEFNKAGDDPNPLAPPGGNAEKQEGVQDGSSESMEMNRRTSRRGNSQDANGLVWSL